MPGWKMGAVLVLLLAGCLAPAEGDDTGDAEAPGAGPSLPTRLDMADCVGLTLTMQVPGEPYDLPPGFEAQGLMGTAADGAYQLPHLELWECQHADVGGPDLGPASFGGIAVIVLDPGVGPEADLHHYVWEAFATGAMLDMLRAHGYPATEAQASVVGTPLGRTGTIQGTGLQATLEHGPSQDGTFDLTTNHHRVGGLFRETRDCHANVPFSAVGTVEAGSTTLAQAEQAFPFAGAEGQDDRCDRVSFEFTATS